MDWNPHRPAILLLPALIATFWLTEPLLSQERPSLSQMVPSDAEEQKTQQTAEEKEKRKRDEPSPVPAAALPDRPLGQGLRAIPCDFTAGDKLKLGFREAFLSPGGYIFSGMSAAITQAREKDQPQKDTGDKIADGLSRYAIRFGTGSTKALFTSGIYPIIFKQDPRYTPSGKQGFGRRFLDAASRVFVTRGDNGRAQFNISRLGGNLTASALANTWERNTPGFDRIGIGPTFQRFGVMVALDVVNFAVLKEFGPDIKRKIFKRKEQRPK